MAVIELKDAPPGVAVYYDKGTEAMEHGNLDYAMDMFEAALGIEPRLLDVRKRLHSAAVQNIKSKPPTKLGVAKAMGGLFKASALLKKDPLESLKATERLLRIDPLNVKFALAQCDAAKAADMPEVAIQTLEIFRANKPPSLAILEPLAQLYLESDQFDLEYPCREQIATLKPGDTAARKELKDAAARLTMGKSGWQHARQSQDANQEDSQSSREPGEMEQILAKIQSEPDNLNYSMALADLQLRSQLYAEAVQTLTLCREMAGAPTPLIERKIQTAQEHLLLFAIAEAEDADDQEKISELRGRLTEMRLDYAALQVKMYPNDLQLKFDLGKLLFENGHTTEAIQQLQQAQRNPHRRVRSLFYLAQAFKAKGQLDIAREQLESALSELDAMDESKKEILYELGLLYEATGQRDEAVKCFREIYAVDIGYRDVATKVEGPTGS